MENITTYTVARKPENITAQTSSTMILPPLAGKFVTSQSDAFEAGVTYQYGDIVHSNGGYYWCVTAAGGAAGETAPSHQGGDASDGTLMWRYIYLGRKTLMITNLGEHDVFVARGFPAEGEKGIVIKAGASFTEGSNGGSRPYKGAWYAIAPDGAALLAISEG